MMVVLSDTSEEEDVHINDWLINEKLARCGKMVRMCDNFPYLHNSVVCNITLQSPASIPIDYIQMYFNAKSDIENVVGTRHDKDQLCNKGTHTLFNVKSENNVKNENKIVEANIPSNKKALLQKLRNINSLNVKSSDTKSQSTDSSKNEKPSGPRKLSTLLEKLRTLNVTSNSNPSISTPKSNHDFKDNKQQIDSDIKANSHDDNEDFKHCALNMNFTVRDSDNDENNEKDFGTFRSLYGGHGLMEPFDWSVIKEKKDRLYETMQDRASYINLHTLLEEHKNHPLINEYKNNLKNTHTITREMEDESESHDLNNLRKESLPVNSYFLNITRKEEEYYLPENNFNYDFNNVRQSVARLRNRMEVQNDKYTAVVVPRNIFETLCSNIQAQSQDTLSSNINTVKINDVTSPIKMTVQSNIINENNEACETKKTEIESRDFDTDIKSSASNMINNENKKIINNKKMFEYDTDSSSECSTNGKTLNPRYKMLLDQMRSMNMNLMDLETSTDLSSKRDSPSSEQIQSSSYSHNSSTNSTMISSDDEQHENLRSQSSVPFPKLSNISKILSTSSSDFSLDCNSKETKCLLLSENDSVSSFNVNDSKQNQLVEIDSIASIVDNSKQPNVTVEMPRISKMLELVLKNTEKASDIELDSDDLSNQESVASDKNCDKKESELVDELMVDCVKCKSPNNDINVHKKTLVPPVLNDCDIESDESNWDIHDIESLLPFEKNWYKTYQISDNESENI